MLRHYHSSPSEEPWSIYFLKSSLPVFSVLCLMLWSVSLTPFTKLEGMTSLIGLIGIYYWSLHGKPYFHPIMVFLLGFWFDLFISSIIGFHTILYLFCYMMAQYMHHRSLERSFLIVWLGFIGYSILTIVIYSIIIQFNHAYANIGQSFLAIVFSAFFYILFHGLFSILKRVFWSFRY